MRCLIFKMIYLLVRPRLLFFVPAWPWEVINILSILYMEKLRLGVARHYPGSCRERSMSICLHRCAIQCHYNQSPKCAIPGEGLPCSHPSEPIRATQIRNVRLKQINGSRVGWNAELKRAKSRHEAPRSRIPIGPLARSSLRLSLWHLKSLLLNEMCILFSSSVSSLK